MRRNGSKSVHPKGRGTSQAGRCTCVCTLLIVECLTLLCLYTVFTLCNSVCVHSVCTLLIVECLMQGGMVVTWGDW